MNAFTLLTSLVFLLSLDSTHAQQPPSVPISARHRTAIETVIREQRVCPGHDDFFLYHSLHTTAPAPVPGDDSFCLSDSTTAVQYTISHRTRSIFNSLPWLQNPYRYDQDIRTDHIHCIGRRQESAWGTNICHYDCRIQ